MADMFESMDSNKLDVKDVLCEMVTQVAVQLFVYKEMLPEERNAEKKIINGVRDDLFRLRGHLNAYLEKEATE